MKKKLSVLLIAVLAFSLTLAGCGGGGGGSQEDENVIKIGAVMPTTGAVATFGQSSLDAVKLAFDQINEAGGVLGGKKLEVINEDNQSKGEETGAAFRKLIEQEKVVAILGSTTSGDSLIGAPIAQEAKIPMLTPTSTAPAVTEFGDYVFRACFLDNYQAEAMAIFAIEELGAKTAAVIVQSDNDYSVGLGKFFVAKFKELGGQIVAEEGYLQEEIDYSAILTNVKSANPDVVYLPSYYDTVGPLLRQAKDAGLDATFLGCDGWDSSEFFSLAQGAEEGGYFSNHYSPAADSELVQNFLSAYESRYGKTPDALAALSYDAAYIMAQAIDEAGSTDPAAIRDALANIEFTGVSGTITFDENRNPIKPIWVNMVKDGKYEVAKIIEP
ncbi:MAG: ABC transporter substrate-binding protein [Firmicutes bacterium]|nr:ABC transporter substrate-binding protein [Bacillota bacterium]